MNNKNFFWISLITLILLQCFCIVVADNKNSKVDISHVVVGNFLSAESVYAKNLAIFSKDQNKFLEREGLDMEYDKITAMEVKDGNIYVAAQKSSYVYILRNLASYGQWEAIGNKFSGTVNQLVIIDSYLYSVGSFSVTDSTSRKGNCVSLNLKDSSPTVNWQQVGDSSPPAFSYLFKQKSNLMGLSQQDGALYALNSNSWTIVGNNINGIPQLKQYNDKLYAYGASSISLPAKNGGLSRGSLLSSSDGKTWDAELTKSQKIIDFVLDNNSDFYYAIETRSGDYNHQVFKQAGTTTSQGFFSTSNGAELKLHWDGKNLYAFNGIYNYAATSSSDYKRPLAGIAKLASLRDFEPAFQGGFSGGNIEHMITSSSEIYFQGNMEYAYNTFANGITGYDKNSKHWVGFGEGPDYGQKINTVYVTKTGKNPQLVIGGSFDLVHGSKVQGIASLNYSSKTITQMGSGLQRGGIVTNGGKAGTVNTINKIDNVIYVGGKFDRSGSTPLRNLAQYDPKVGEWTDSHGGINGNVITSHRHGSELILGGSFTRANKLNVANIVKYNPKKGEFSPLGSGVDDTVNHVISNGEQILACGKFESAGGLRVNSVAIWESEHWSPLKCNNDSPSLGSLCRIGSECKELKFHDGDLYIRTLDAFYRYNDQQLIALNSRSSQFNPPTTGSMMVSSPEKKENLWTIGMSETVHFAPYSYFGEFNPKTLNWIHNGMGGFSSVPSSVSVASSLVEFNLYLTIGTLSACLILAIL